MARSSARASPEIRREEILAAALACFAEGGYYETTVDDIAARAGLSKGAVYWHFDGKREIFLAALDLYVEESLALFRAAAEGATTAREGLERISDAALASVPDSGLMQATLDYLAHATRDEEFAARFRRLWTGCRELVGAQLQRGIDGGEFRSFDVDAMATAMFAAMDGLFLQSIVLPEVRPQPIWNVTLEVLLKGVER
jgi:AcrR family transcriptional regulator